ncbi:Bifunctional inhibitor/plant lipid transfer protein/seed storage helical domain [Macleaya cordata]|uniref:Bifunctional inhibitor/plant lipid transfer protein/seed storage helical domain n=1 Tax=Macleaya cordata TaxID=56857 RepID=A0A200QVL2_MACCD|nr:Bifunctional inhibitor/plant lipid transfer protein/seed storage helical domain [Macleaya cordata]
MSYSNIPNSSLVAMIIILLLATHAYVKEAVAAGECGKTPISNAAASLSPCLGAAGSISAKVPPVCCSRVGMLLRNSPRCLCAVFLSPLVKQAGINPAIAITIPKRCNIKNRPAGKKCGSKLITLLIN